MQCKTTFNKISDGQKHKMAYLSLDIQPCPNHGGQRVAFKEICIDDDHNDDECDLVNVTLVFCSFGSMPSYVH